MSPTQQGDVATTLFFPCFGKLAGMRGMADTRLALRSACQCRACTDAQGNAATLLSHARGRARENVTTHTSEHALSVSGLWRRAYTLNHRKRGRTASMVSRVSCDVLRPHRTPVASARHAQLALEPCKDCQRRRECQQGARHRAKDAHPRRTRPMRMPATNAMYKRTSHALCRARLCYVVAGKHGKGRAGADARAQRVIGDWADQATQGLPRTCMPRIRHTTGPSQKAPEQATAVHDGSTAPDGVMGHGDRR